MNLSIVLVHHPVLDRDGATVTTAITNLDLHDMARSARTYGLSAVYIVHPIEAQRQLAQSIVDHWAKGTGKKRIPDRSLAMEIVRVVPTLDDVYTMIAGAEGRRGVHVWTTAAKAHPGGVISYVEARPKLHEASKPVAMLFGTGWGLARSLIEDADVRLCPLRAEADTGYNHLSVRAACAISLDRLLGER
ncbi:MAG: RNA methyltransferase [Polyangiaceae bacterium]|nr:RNA methyltransferase [Polyangiaceae bacterium]